MLRGVQQAISNFLPKKYSFSKFQWTQWHLLIIHFFERKMDEDYVNLVKSVLIWHRIVEDSSELSFQDLSKGCDQIVISVTDESRDDTQKRKFICKIPKEEKDKVDKQYLMALAAGSAGFNSAGVLFHDEDMIVEEFVAGRPLSLEEHGDCADVWIKLGVQLRALHSIPASGYSNRVDGEICNKFPVFDSFQAKHAGAAGLRWEHTESITNIDQYFLAMLPRVRRVARPVLLHYDVSCDNIIVSHDHSLVTLIDFGDAGMGDPMEDFSRLVLLLWSSPRQLEWVLEGYGGITDEDRLWMEFFVIVFLTWGLQDGERGEHRRQQLAVAQEIVNKGLQWIRQDRIL